MHLNPVSLFLFAFLLLTACSSESSTDSSTQTTLSLSGEWALALDEAAENWLTVGEGSGVRLQNSNGDTLAHWDQAAEHLDFRLTGKSPQEYAIYASIDSAKNSLLLFQVNPAQATITPVFNSPAFDFPIEGLCLGKHPEYGLQVFLLSEHQQAHQIMLLADALGRWHMRPVRQVSTAPGVESCAVADNTGIFYELEPGSGIWAHNADPEAEAGREIVDLRTPFGGLGTDPVAIRALGDGLVVLDADSGTLHYLQNFQGEYRNAARLQLDDVTDGTTLTVNNFNGKVLLAVFDEGQSLFASTTQNVGVHHETQEIGLPFAFPVVETDPVPNWGDAADDPEIWLNPRNPAASHILGTNKRGGLHVYDLQGRQLQQLMIGRLNNVDIRYDVPFGNQRVDLAAASNRDLNAISLFMIERQNGTVTHVGDISTDLQDIYGLCLYQPAEDEVHVFANDSDGSYRQFLLHLHTETWQGELVRSFSVDSQPEGCVASDRQRRLYVGEEQHGIWMISADPDGGTELASFAVIDELLHEDVEGLSLYTTGSTEYLLASSQGNNSYVLYETTAPYRPLGAFRVGMNASDPVAMIDGSSETDGLAVSSANLGGDFTKGLLVVQDGRNVLPATKQNFKLVPWHSVMQALQLESMP